jgi:tRNA(Ile)-lysidine synthase|tara:strand:+ start:30 stop:1415 length:1386 start_codon:yes stop_codon:yes gene_type:complete
MAFSHHQLVSHTGSLKAHLQAPRWVLAVSGGLDSMCLLHALVQLQQDHHCPPLSVIHINHGLQLQADQWQQQVEHQCQAYGLICSSHKVTLCPQQRQRLGLEAAARNARYDVFKQQVHQDEVLLLGQHADDQSETLFLRLLRGAGVAGLRAMPQQRKLGLASLVRPLLSVRQTDLYGYAQAQGLTWCEDPSNQNSDFDRNYLRHQVMPLLRQRWPALDERVATVACLMSDTQALLDEVAAADFKLMHRLTEFGECLPCAQLQALSRGRRYNLLRYWFARRHVPMPDYAAMQGIDTQFLDSAIDRQPYLQLGQWCLRRNQGYLLLMPHAKQASGAVMSYNCKITLQMLQAGSIALHEGWLCLTQGAKVAMVLAQGDDLERRFRVGGERCKPMGRAHSQSLKKLLQEIKVPAWERDQVPLFYVNGELAMVADLWVNCGFEATAGGPAWNWSKATKNTAFDCDD